MQISTANTCEWTKLFWLCLCLGLSGCFGARSIDPQKLPGTWRASAEGMEVVWTFSSDGQVRIEFGPDQGWWKHIARMETRGCWRLEGNQLTIELQETPASLALLGENWQGQQQTLQIMRLTDQELAIAGMEFRFRRSLEPAQ
ncbi:MAG: hypothetical protein U0872_07015 [Planctomycetaceae bacterium]